MKETEYRAWEPSLPPMTAEAMAERLSAYVEPAVLREMLSGPTPEREAASEEVVLLFADIRGFTRFAQEISSAQLIAVLDLFLETAGACIHENGGLIDKYMGDCVMAYWRVRDHEDGLYTACKTALELQACSGAFTAFVREETGRDLGIGIGIHAGPALLCHVGHREYRAYTVIGSTVNIACRLEEYAAPGEICISEESAGRLGDRIVTEPSEKLLRRRNRDVAVPMKKLKGLSGQA